MLTNQISQTQTWDPESAQTSDHESVTKGGGVGRPYTISDPVDQTKSKAYAGFEGQILHSKLRFSDGTDFQSSLDGGLL